MVLVVDSSDFLRSRIYLGLSLPFSGLKQIQEEGRRWFRENRARSQPPSQPVVVFFFSFLFLLLGCGFDNDLIMVGLWVMACGGCGLWARWWWCEFVGSDSGGDGVGGNASWVSIFFFFFLLFGCGFCLILAS